MNELFNEYKYAYYYRLRMEARRRVVEALNRRIKTKKHKDTWRGITLASIKSDAIEYAEFKWSKYYDGDTHSALPVKWERLYYSYSAKLAHFNIAVWQDLADGKILRGLCFGKPSRGKTHLTINWLERSPEPDYFKGGILLPILACAEEYAKLLGCKRIFVKDALDPTMFEKYGYSVSDAAPMGGLYLVKEMDDGN